MNKTLRLFLSFLFLSLAHGFMTPPTFASVRCASPTALNMGSSDEIFKGTCKWFDTIKGFGFILPKDGSPDIFVHQSAIQAEGFRSLADGEEVEYRVEVDSNGRRKAVQVTGPDGEDVQGAPFRPANDFNSY